jgi:hypothetical protein
VRTIELGGRTLAIQANVLTGLFFEQEFGAGLLPELARYDRESDRYVLVKAAWAMAKSVNYKAPWPSFVEWASMLSDIDYADVPVFNPIIEEINTGFFRGAAQAGGENGRCAEGLGSSEDGPGRGGEAGEAAEGRHAALLDSSCQEDGAVV